MYLQIKNYAGLNPEGGRFWGLNTLLILYCDCDAMYYEKFLVDVFCAFIPTHPSKLFQAKPSPKCRAMPITMPIYVGVVTGVIKTPFFKIIGSSFDHDSQVFLILCNTFNN